MRSILWWGRFDPEYSRNRILRRLMAELGWEVRDFQPRLSPLGRFEAALRRLPRPDLIWVPCFRQRDLGAALDWGRAKGVPVIADPLISAWDKQVFERARFDADSRKAVRLKAWEIALFGEVDLLIADTQAHARFFRDDLEVREEQIRVLFVGAEEALFTPQPPASADRPIEALFYGSFIGLQSPQTIIEAARHYARLEQAPAVRWRLIGAGPLRDECELLADGLDAVRFEPPVPYPELPARIGRAHLALGVFGASAKAGRVIPNKVFQSLACARPVVTRIGEGYPEDLVLQPESGLIWVPPDDPQGLAEAVAELAAQSDRLAEYGVQARRSFDKYLSERVVRQQLYNALGVFC